MSSRRDINIAVKEFNATISEILKISDMLLDDNDSKANLESLKRKLSILKSIGPSEPLAQASPFFLRYSDEVKNRDEKFFTTADIRQHAAAVGKPITKNNDYIEDFITKLRAAYHKCDQSEKDILYIHARTMLRCSIEWKFYMEG